MTRIIALHGGTTFSRYEDYLDSLHRKTIYPNRLYFQPMWRENLGRHLGADYEVLVPTMPNKANARYEEWAIWFERILNAVDGPSILIGHSLGAVFLAKYLSHTPLPTPAIATFLIAAPFNDETDEELGDFRLEAISPLFHEQSGRVVLFNGADDPVIRMSERDQYIAAIPNAKSIVIPAPDHFMRENFPELLTVIKSIC